MDEDLVLALRLQEEWDAQAARREAARVRPSLVDASWELVDPTPDLQALFVQFNDRFFWGRLEAVEVKWSARMTLCAGICSYEGRGGMCSIRLSEPLLKLRPRKDLVETLLHEMIHAYLFVTNNDRDREGHGPEFCRHMRRINRLTGANITVYHTFHDEVDEYRQHWWRCDGPCQHKQPYYGYVKRATNRAPSPRDYWWAEHQKTCGGTYTKIKEPENYSKKGKGKAKPGKQPASAMENKDEARTAKAWRLPLTGKGDVLAERSASPSSEKPAPSRAFSDGRGLLSQDHPASAQRPDSNIEAKFKQNGFSSKKSSRVVSPAPIASHQSVLSSYYPIVSVADQKVVRGASGSPVTHGTVADTAGHFTSSGSGRRLPLPTVSLRSASPAAASATEATACVPSKRPRLEGKAASDNFFIKKEQTQGDWKSSAAPAAAAAQSCGSSRGPSQLVSCPVCRGEVLGSQINEHLDWCLQGDSTKSRR